MDVHICRISEIEPKYYADGEDAYAMRRNLNEFKYMVCLPGILCLLKKTTDCGEGFPALASSLCLFKLHIWKLEIYLSCM